MKENLNQSAYPNSEIDKKQLSLEKQFLALDALSRLTRQFSEKPDFQRLIEILLLTLSGQFSVADLFALLQMPGSPSMKQSFFGVGVFKANPSLALLELTPDHFTYFSQHGSVHQVRKLKSSPELTKLSFILEECGVKLVCPLLHNDRLLGIIGIGHKLTQEPYEQEDIDLLTAIINTVTPLISNSFLFWEITSLKSWYLDILNSVKQGVFVFENNYRLKKVNSAGFELLKAFNPNISDENSLYRESMEVIFPDTIFGGWAKQFMQTKNRKQSKLMQNLIAKTGETERIYNIRLSRTNETSETGADLVVTLDDVTTQRESEQRLFDLQKFADKGLMVSSIAHELNNFLGVIFGGLQLVQLDLNKGDQNKVKATLDQLNENMAKMKRFTAGLVGYTKLDTRKQLTNLNSVIAEILPFVSVQKRFRSITLTTELDPNLPEFLIDSDQIAQLLLNFINNAADAINESSQEKGKITIKTAQDKDKVILSVSDNGVGIKPEVKEKLFKSRLTTKEKGHGYGLVTCAEIVKNHQGSIEINSRVGKGTIFSLRFPIINQA
jgi:signal transduction histidine kinase